MVLIYILLHFIFIVSIYIIVDKRMKILSYRHGENTGIESLSRGYRIIRRKMFLILAILFIISSLVILTYFENDILYEAGLYDNQETHNINDF